MTGQTVWVSIDVFRKADFLLKGAGGPNSSGRALKDGVQLLLMSDLSVGGEDPGPGPGRVDATGLMAKGLAALSNNPYEALGVPVGAKTVEIRKAYKKAALMYHPDKNPKTTPLFQIMQLACDRLSDHDQRLKEEKKAGPMSNPKTAQQQSYQQPYPQKRPEKEREKENPRAQPQPQKQQPYPQPKKDNAYERYRSAAPENGYGAANGMQQDDRQRHNETVEEARKRAGNANEASSKFEAEVRARETAERRATEARAAAVREVAAQKQRDRDEIMKEGQKQYFEEQAKLRQAKLDKERAASEAAVASRRSMYTNLPSATPDGSGAQIPPTHRQSSVAGIDLSNLRGFKKVPTRVPASFSDNSTTTQAAAAAAAAAEAANGRYANQEKPPIPKKPKENKVPIPISFAYLTVSDTAVELDWKLSIYSYQSVLIELSWRKKCTPIPAQWQSATRLIKGLRCKKNNLELSSGSTGNTMDKYIYVYTYMYLHIYIHICIYLYINV
jgi:curved DNA-binding protein CbpA